MKACFGKIQTSVGKPDSFTEVRAKARARAIAKAKAKAKAIAITDDRIAY